mmetsp:Transcript_13720/g.52257  ORF Transcript_13720/g.52257 Transcript_13720/m.52257 type:complete len:240 (-) Transcript_13720:978-1697(-)
MLTLTGITTRGPCMLPAACAGPARGPPMASWWAMPPWARNWAALAAAAALACWCADAAAAMVRCSWARRWISLRRGAHSGLASERALGLWMSDTARPPRSGMRLRLRTCADWVYRSAPDESPAAMSDALTRRAKSMAADWVPFAMAGELRITSSKPPDQGAPLAASRKPTNQAKRVKALEPLMSVCTDRRDEASSAFSKSSSCLAAGTPLLMAMRRPLAVAGWPARSPLLTLATLVAAE